jgi:hypothetical protein
MIIALESFTGKTRMLICLTIARSSRNIVAEVRRAILRRWMSVIVTYVGEK